MDKAMYKETLEGKVERTMEYGVDKLGFERHQLICQHENDPKYTPKVVKEHLQQRFYNALQWPEHSPDLKTTENM
ncbi:hypothetical protein RO3G_16722 [Rhizopus delemar RA 99-880]|uniref:Tc1-like transposase DDE domain-containing protein n=3 Tax=Rhizopus TaxID=4842 RepID=I1CU81_RHIO9|nr:hypothetical protein RO3G_16722 [Rhizopus delemar RA 99-880]|eukprot:EIE92011.1 hypothetical protein RO3G_16722 [Rhizopus delemar RA 99-880]